MTSPAGSLDYTVMNFLAEGDPSEATPFTEGDRLYWWFDFPTFGQVQITPTVDVPAYPHMGIAINVWTGPDPDDLTAIAWSASGYADDADPPVWTILNPAGTRLLIEVQLSGSPNPEDTGSLVLTAVLDATVNGGVLGNPDFSVPNYLASGEEAAGTRSRTGEVMYWWFTVPAASQVTFTTADTTANADASVDFTVYEYDPDTDTWGNDYDSSHGDLSSPAVLTLEAPADQTYVIGVWAIDGTASGDSFAAYLELTVTAVPVDDPGGGELIKVDQIVRVVQPVQTHVQTVAPGEQIVRVTEPVRASVRAVERPERVVRVTEPQRAVPLPQDAPAGLVRVVEESKPRVVKVATEGQQGPPGGDGQPGPQGPPGEIPDGTVHSFVLIFENALL